MTSMRFLMREPSKPKRDFLRENKREVREIEKQFRETRIDDNKLEFRNQRYANIQPKVQTRMNRYQVILRRPASALPSSAFPSKTQKRPVSAYYAASQTATCDEAIQCCENSILSYTKDLRDQGTQTEDTPLADKIVAPSSCPWEDRHQLTLHLDQENTNFEIAERAHQATQRTSSSGSAPTTKGWHAFDSGDKGGVAEESIPPVHPAPTSKTSNPMSKENSAQTLSQLRITQNQLIVELNKLPVRSTTLRVQNKRRDIDSQLDKVETLIASLTKPF